MTTVQSQSFSQIEKNKSNTLWPSKALKARTANTVIVILEIIVEAQTFHLSSDSNSEIFPQKTNIKGDELV